MRDETYAGFLGLERWMSKAGGHGALPDGVMFSNLFQVTERLLRDDRLLGC